MNGAAWRSAFLALCLWGTVRPVAAAPFFREVVREAEAATFVVWLEPSDLQIVCAPDGYSYQMQGATPFGAPGQPLLPRLIRHVEVPPGCDAKLRIRDKILHPARSLPRPALARDDSGLPTLGGRGPSIQLGPVTTRVGNRIATLIVDPVRLDEEGVALLSIARIRIDFPVLEGTTHAEVHHRDATPEAPGYLMLVTDQLLDSPSLEALAIWRTRRGFNVSIKPVSVTGGDPFAIKDLIAAEYERGTTHLLFVGDDPSVPVFPGGLDPSEHWYTTVDGYDLYSDVAMGRLAVSSDAELEAQVQRTISWERDPAPGLDTALLVAHRAGHPGRFTALSETIAQASYVHPLVFLTEYGGAGSTNPEVQESVSGSVAIVAYRGYGGAKDWQFWGADELSFRGSDVVPGAAIVLNVACDNGWIDDPTGPSLAEEWMSRGRAVGVLASLRRSYDEPNNALEEKLFDLMLNEGVDRAGELLNRAREFLLDTQGQYGSHDAKIYLWLGDPDAPLRHARLNRIEANVPPTLAVGGPDVAITVAAENRPLSGALVTLSRGTLLLARSQSDDHGRAQLRIGEDVGIGPATIAVTGAQLVPVEKSINLIPAGSGEETSAGSITLGDELR